MSRGTLPVTVRSHSFFVRFRRSWEFRILMSSTSATQRINAPQLPRPSEGHAKSLAGNMAANALGRPNKPRPHLFVWHVHSYSRNWEVTSPPDRQPFLAAWSQNLLTSRFYSGAVYSSVFPSVPPGPGAPSSVKEIHSPGMFSGNGSARLSEHALCQHFNKSPAPTRHTYRMVD